MSPFSVKTIELAPLDAQYYDSRGATLHKMGCYEEALKDETRAIELDPANPQYYTRRAKTLRAMFRIEEAEKDEAKAEELARQ